MKTLIASFKARNRLQKQEKKQQVINGFDLYEQPLKQISFIAFPLSVLLLTVNMQRL